MIELPVLALEGAPYLEYLPVVNLGGGQLQGFEALVRWHHPTEGRISPGVLIPWAEANDAIDVLGEWIFAEACSQATQWSPHMQLGVNCSTSQLRQGKAVRLVASALEHSGLAPERLAIEVTEQSLLDPLAVAELEEIASLGVQLAVDDVGSSWSTFEPIKHLAVCTVKIDRQFVSGLEPVDGVNRLVVETVVRLTHAAGIDVLVEGVEDERELSIVRELGADTCQGFFFTKPLSTADALVMGAAHPVHLFSLGSAANVIARPSYPLRQAPAPVRIEDMVSPAPATELTVFEDVDLDALADAIAAMLDISESDHHTV